MGTYHGFLAYNSTSQTCTDRQMVPLDLDTNDHDTDGMHFTSTSALTGTVSKTATSTTLTGSSTAFTSELSVGQVISIPKTLSGTVSKTSGSATITGSGTSFASEVAVGQRISIPGGTRTDLLWVKSIASNTSLTVDHTPFATASGQTATSTEYVGIASIASDTSATLLVAAGTSVSGATATRRNHAWAIQTAGYWDFYGYWFTNANMVQDAPITFFVNGQPARGASFTPWTKQPNDVAGIGQVRLLPRHFAVGDILFAGMYSDNDGTGGDGVMGGTTAYTQTVVGGFLIGT